MGGAQMQPPPSWFWYNPIAMAAYRVLIVDDQREVRRVLTEGIRSLGLDFDVIETPSGEEGLLEASRKPVDLLVADVRLPGISGLELVGRIRKRLPGIKIILITGMVDPKIRKQVADAGVDAFFFKPIEIADFLDAIERSLGLVKTFFPTAPISDDPLAAAETEKLPLTIAERLSHLRVELAASTVAMLDEEGRVYSQAGELPGEFSGPLLLPALMDTLNASARMAHALGANRPHSLLAVSGAELTAYFTHIGLAYTLIITLPGLLQPEHLTRVGNAITAQRDELVNSLAGAETAPTKPKRETGPLAQPPEEEVVDLEALPALDALFQQASQQIPRREEVDAFWDTLVENGGSNVGKPDTLTYDQAKKLGLAPGEK